MTRRAKWTFVLALIVISIQFGRIRFSGYIENDLSNMADRVAFGFVAASLVLLIAIPLVISRVATAGHGGQRTAAIVTLISAACCFIGLAFDLLLWEELGAAIGPGFLILIGLPSLGISSMLAWLMSMDQSPSGESNHGADSGT